MSPTKFWSKIKFVVKKIFGQINFGKKNVLKKHFNQQKNLVKKHLGQENVGQKYFGQTFDFLHNLFLMFPGTAEILLTLSFCGGGGVVCKVIFVSKGRFQKKKS